MKVYVDELPKSCNDCKFRVFIAYTKNGWEHSKRYCSIMKDNYDCKCSKENCPLQSLTDYTNQVRKEVCEQVKNICNESCYMNRYNNIDKETLFNVLDQIQGETK